MKKTTKTQSIKIDYKEGGTDCLPLPKRNADYWRGFDFACDLLEDMGYTKSSSHPYNIADCLKGKMNRLPKSKIRKNIFSTYAILNKTTRMYADNAGGICNAVLAHKNKKTLSDKIIRSYIRVTMKEYSGSLNNYLSEVAITFNISKGAVHELVLSEKSKLKKIK